MSEMTHLVGLDLGQTSDPSALCVLERTGDPDAWSYACRYLKRWQLGTSYLVIVADTLKLMAAPLLRDPLLCVDQTGVGRPVVDLFRAACRHPLRAVTITAGHRWSRQPDGAYHVPKKDLVGCLQSLLGHQRLAVAESLREAATLRKELVNFRVKITAAANETFSAWREGASDDIVLAIAVAAWVGENCCAGPLLPPGDESLSLLARDGQGVFDTGDIWDGGGGAGGRW